MKIIKQFLVTFIIFINSTAFGQSYKPLLDNYNEWHFTTCYSGCNTDIYYTDGDTIVNGVSYKILDGFHYISRTFLLTEDTIARTVTMTFAGTKIETFLLYDFSLNVGDSIDIQNPISPFPATPGYFIVDSIVMRPLVDGIDYRHFYLSAQNPSTAVTSAVWVEGIGSLSLINAPGGYNDINETGHLSCFFKNGVSHYSKLDSIGDCSPVQVLDLPKNNIEYEINIYPKPTKDDLNIETTFVMKQIELYDINGRLILSDKINTQKYNVKLTGSIPAGIYLLNIIDQNGTKHIRKVVVTA